MTHFVTLPTGGVVDLDAMSQTEKQDFIRQVKVWQGVAAQAPSGLRDALAARSDGYHTAADDIRASNADVLRFGAEGASNAHWAQFFWTSEMVKGLGDATAAVAKHIPGVGEALAKTWAYSTKGTEAALLFGDGRFADAGLKSAEAGMELVPEEAKDLKLLGDYSLGLVKTSKGLSEGKDDAAYDGAETLGAGAEMLGGEAFGKSLSSASGFSKGVKDYDEGVRHFGESGDLADLSVERSERVAAHGEELAQNADQKSRAIDENLVQLDGANSDETWAAMQHLFKTDPELFEGDDDGLEAEIDERAGHLRLLAPAFQPELTIPPTVPHAEDEPAESPRDEESVPIPGEPDSLDTPLARDLDSSEPFTADEAASADNGKAEPGAIGEGTPASPSSADDDGDWTPYGLRKYPDIGGFLSPDRGPSGDIPVPSNGGTHSIGAGAGGLPGLGASGGDDGSIMGAARRAEAADEAAQHSRDDATRSQSAAERLAGTVAGQAQSLDDDASTADGAAHAAQVAVGTSTEAAGRAQDDAAAVQELLSQVEDLSGRADASEHQAEAADDAVRASDGVIESARDEAHHSEEQARSALEQIKQQGEAGSRSAAEASESVTHAHEAAQATTEAASQVSSQARQALSDAHQVGEIAQQIETLAQTAAQDRTQAESGVSDSAGAVQQAQGSLQLATEAGSGSQHSLDEAQHHAAEAMGSANKAEEARQRATQASGEADEQAAAAHQLEATAAQSAAYAQQEAGASAEAGQRATQAAEATGQAATDARGRADDAKGAAADAASATGEAHEQAANAQISSSHADELAVQADGLHQRVADLLDSIQQAYGQANTSLQATLAAQQRAAIAREAMAGLQAQAESEKSRVTTLMGQIDGALRTLSASSHQANASASEARSYL